MFILGCKCEESTLASFQEDQNQRDSEGKTHNTTSLERHKHVALKKYEFVLHLRL